MKFLRKFQQHNLKKPCLLVQIWNCSTDESNHRVHDFFKSQHFAAGILPIPGKPRLCAAMHPNNCSWQALSHASAHPHIQAAETRRRHSIVCSAWLKDVGGASYSALLRSTTPFTACDAEAGGGLQERTTACSACAAAAIWWSSPRGSTASSSRRWPGWRSTSRASSRRCTLATTGPWRASPRPSLRSAGATAMPPCAQAA